MLSKKKGDFRAKNLVYRLTVDKISEEKQHHKLEIVIF